MSVSSPILVTGAAGQIGGVGGQVVEFMRDRGVAVRALVRREDERAAKLRHLGAEVVIADLTRPEEVVPALRGCRRVYFGMSVSASYLEATLVMAAAALAQGDLELLVNMSQMSLSQMDLSHTTGSPQHLQHWLGEQAINWSGLPAIHLRPTVFQENPFFMAWAADSIARTGELRLPFGTGRSSPVAARDVAEVAATLLLDPAPPVGQVIELTGPSSADLHAMAEDYAAVLGYPVHYSDIPLADWRDGQLKGSGLPAHVHHHLLIMAEMHAANRYDRLTDGVERILGRPATSLRQTLGRNRRLFPSTPDRDSVSAG